MKLFVAGSRSISDFDLEPYIPDGADMIICGGAEGIDAIAEKYADEMQISKEILRPDYKKYQKRAPLVRNEEMAKRCDMGLIIWDGKSKGTRHSINALVKAAKSFQVVVV